MPKILWIASDRAGCGVYRCFIPALSLDEKHGGAFENLFTFHEQVRNVESVALDDVDLIVFQRAVGTLFLDVMKAAKARDIKVVFEMDDDLFNVPRANPASWFWSRKQVRKVLEQELDVVDRILVSTPPLKDSLTALNKVWGDKAVVCWNHIHPDVWGDDVLGRVEKHPNEHVVIGWQGSATHDVDFRVAIPALRRILDEFPHTMLRLMGSVPASMQGLIPPNRFQWVNGVPFERYPSVVAFLNFDIGIAPVTPSKFNRGKSNLKFLEYCALGVPCVASKVYPYETTIEQGVTGFIADTDEEWYQALRTLVTSPELRANMGAIARQKVWAEWGPQRAQRWHDVFTELLGAPHVLLPEFRRHA